jgi:hypothetical protein
MQNVECRVQNPDPPQVGHSAFFTLDSSFESGADGETCTLVGRFARQFTKLLLSLLSHAGMKWWVATVLPRALRFKRPLHRCNACNPIATRRRSRTAAARPVKSSPAPGFRVA